MPESAAIVHIDIQDVRVRVALLASDTPVEREAGAASVWPDARGLARWLTDPQQQPFFDAVRLDQIRAQVSCQTQKCG